MNAYKQWETHQGIVVDSLEQYDIIECEQCGFKHVIPLAIERDLYRFYTDKFYQNKEDYIKNHTEDLAWSEIEYHEKFDLFEIYIDSNDSRSSTILDIGSGPGYFLNTGRQRGWRVTGIEPGKPAYEFSKYELGLNIINDFFSAENYTEFGNFDVVHLNNVLEHITTPHELIKHVYGILNPGGIVCITVPNDYNPLQSISSIILEKPPWWVVPEEHINYFNHESLSKLIEFHDFKVVYQTASFPLEMFLLMGDDYIADKTVGKTIHQRRKNFELSLASAGKTALKRGIYSKLSELGLGRQITVIGQKKISRY